MDDMKAYLEEISAAVAFLRPHVPEEIKVGMVLGSGLSGLSEEVRPFFRADFEDIPGFPVSTVRGHRGELIAGHLGDTDVVLLRGRVHLYEGYSAQRVVFPVRVLAALGLETLVLTNAAGGIDKDLAAGDIMVLTDHLNLTGQNPLTGPNIERFGPRFPDLTEVYSRALREAALRAARSLGMELREGVYAAMAGPNYETPAEVRMLETLGAQAVGMSTVPEAITARHGGLRVLAFSIIANLAAGLQPGKLNHEDVLDSVRDAGDRLAAILRAMLRKL